MEGIMRKRIFSWITIISFGIGVLYAFESARLPCQHPLEYRDGQFDNRFGISRDEFRTAIHEAEAPWEAALDHDLFEYRDGASFPVNLVFDERQQRTIDSQKLADERTDVGASQADIREKYTANAALLDTRRKEYTAVLTQFERDLERYNRRVLEWNASDRIDEDEFDQLHTEGRRLAEAERDLEVLRGNVNALVALVNRYAKEEEKIVDRYNAKVETFTETYGAGGTFDQGVYGGTAIDIYQFDDRNHLVMALAHEFGHALGIGHVADPKSIMYPILAEQDLDPPIPSSEDREALIAVCSVTAWDLLDRDLRHAWLLVTH